MSTENSKFVQDLPSKEDILRSNPDAHLFSELFVAYLPGTRKSVLYSPNPSFYTTVDCLEKAKPLTGDTHGFPFLPVTTHGLKERMGLPEKVPEKVLNELVRIGNSFLEKVTPRKENGFNFGKSGVFLTKSSDQTTETQYVYKASCTTTVNGKVFSKHGGAFPLKDFSGLTLESESLDIFNSLIKRDVRSGTTVEVSDVDLSEAKEWTIIPDSDAHKKVVRINFVLSGEPARMTLSFFKQEKKSVVSPLSSECVENFAQVSVNFYGITIPTRLIPSRSSSVPLADVGTKVFLWDPDVSVVLVNGGFVLEETFNYLVSEGVVEEKRSLYGYPVYVYNKKYCVSQSFWREICLEGGPQKVFPLAFCNRNDTDLVRALVLRGTGLHFEAFVHRFDLVSLRRIGECVAVLSETGAGGFQETLQNYVRNSGGIMPIMLANANEEPQKFEYRKPGDAKQRHKRQILDYSTRVESVLSPLPQPASKLQYGIEWEVSCKSSENVGLHAALAYQSVGDEHILCKRDGSVNYGYEIVTRPGTLEQHKQEIEKLFLTSSWISGLEDHVSCGVHVHVSRAALTQLQIGRIIAFIHSPQNREFIKTIARRLSERWADYRILKHLTNKSTREMAKVRNYACKDPLETQNQRNTYEESIQTYQMLNLPPWLTAEQAGVFYVKNTVPEVQYQKYKYSDSNKYVAVNTKHKHTIEFRMFKGTTDKQILFSYLEFVEALVVWTSGISGLSDCLDYRRFLDWLKGEYEPKGFTTPLPAMRNCFPNLAAVLGLVKPIPDKYSKKVKESSGDTLEIPF